MIPFVTDSPAPLHQITDNQNSSFLVYHGSRIPFLDGVMRISLLLPTEYSPFMSPIYWVLCLFLTLHIVYVKFYLLVG